MSEGGSGLIVLEPCLRNDVLSFQLNDFLMNSALLLKFQKALSQVKMETGGTHRVGAAWALWELGELQATSILKGDYDMKIKGQDYFTSKENQVSFTHNFRRL